MADAVRLAESLPGYTVSGTGRHCCHQLAVPLPLALEIIIVDDGSDDGTREVLATLVDVAVRGKDPAEEEVPTVLFPAQDAD